MENWRVIPGFSNYSVSNLGRVKYTFIDKFIERKLTGDKKYFQVLVHHFGSSKYHRVHRLVLLAFDGEPEEGQICCHNNGNELDNRLENLRWDTTKSNSDDQIEHGTKRIYENHHKSKLTNDEVLSIRSLVPHRGLVKKLTKFYNVSESTIRDILKNKTWKNL
jgi:hypothetical protein